MQDVRENNSTSYLAAWTNLMYQSGTQVMRGSIFLTTIVFNSRQHAVNFLEDPFSTNQLAEHVHKLEGDSAPTIHLSEWPDPPDKDNKK